MDTIYEQFPGTFAWEDDHFGLEDDGAGEAEQDAPDEDDLVTEDFRHVYSGGRCVLTIAEGEDFEAAILAYQAAEQYWPNVWFISDHGNCHLWNLRTPATCGA